MSDTPALLIQTFERPTTFPTIWNGFGPYMMPPRIAVWFHTRGDYQIYEINRNNYPAIVLTPTNTERTQPFYFVSVDEDAQSRNFTLYKPRARVHTHQQLGTWFTGGWLCRLRWSSQNPQRRCLVPVVPILGVSDTRPLPFVGNVGLVRSMEFHEWAHFQTPFHFRPILHNRILAPPVEIDTAPKKMAPASVPVFVAEVLVKDALEKEQMCPITFEPVSLGGAAVTSCFHVFERGALEEWLRSHEDCPVCKQTCSATFV